MRILGPTLCAAVLLSISHAIAAPPPFPGVAGNYTGLSIPTDDDSTFSTAVLNIDVLDTGALSGIVNKAGIRRPLKGKFDPETRHFEKRIRVGHFVDLDGIDKPLFLLVSCDLDPETRTITGLVNDVTADGPIIGIYESNFVLTGEPPDKPLGDALAGDRQSSFIDPPDTGDAQEIPGDGFTLVNVGKNKLRSGRFVGKLPDSYPYSAGTPLHGKRYPFMSPVYGKPGRDADGTKTYGVFTGITYGYVDVSADANSIPQLSAPLRWVKAPTEETYYRAGFSELVSFLTKRYPKSRGGLVPIGLARKPGNATLTLDRGNLTEKIQVSLTMAPGSTKVIGMLPPSEGAGKNPYKVKITANALLGTFSGSFIHPDSGKKTKFSGAFRAGDLATPGEGRGSFIGSIDLRGPEPLPARESGSVRIAVTEAAED